MHPIGHSRRHGGGRQRGALHEADIAIAGGSDRAMGAVSAKGASEIDARGKPSRPASSMSTHYTPRSPGEPHHAPIQTA